MKKKLYDILGVNEKATKEEIKKAHRKKAQENHPDKGGDKEEFLEVQKAYEVLMDDMRRKMYDDTGGTDEVRDVFLSHLAEIFLKIIADPYFDEKTKNLFDGLNYLVKQNIQKNKNDIKKIISVVRKLEETSKRIHGNNESFFHEVSAHNVKTLKGQLKLALDDKKINGKIKNFIKDMSYDIDTQDLKEKRIRIPLININDF